MTKSNITPLKLNSKITNTNDSEVFNTSDKEIKNDHENDQWI
jgi:hypothetical protein